MNTLLRVLILLTAVTQSALAGDKVPLEETLTRLTTEVRDRIQTPKTPREFIERGYARLFLGELDEALRDFMKAGTSREALLCQLVAVEAQQRANPNNTAAKTRAQRIRATLLDDDESNREAYPNAIYLHMAALQPAQRTRADQLAWLVTLGRATPDLVRAAHDQGELIAKRLAEQLWHPDDTLASRRQTAILTALKSLGRAPVKAIKTSQNRLKSAKSALIEDTIQLEILVGEEAASDEMKERREYLHRMFVTLSLAHNIVQPRTAP